MALLFNSEFENSFDDDFEICLDEPCDDDIFFFTPKEPEVVSPHSSTRTGSAMKSFERRRKRKGQALATALPSAASPTSGVPSKPEATHTEGKRVEAANADRKRDVEPRKPSHPAKQAVGPKKATRQGQTRTENAPAAPEHRANRNRPAPVPAPARGSTRSGTTLGPRIPLAPGQKQHTAMEQAPDVCNGKRGVSRVVTAAPEEDAPAPPADKRLRSNTGKAVVSPAKGPIAANKKKCSPDTVILATVADAAPATQHGAQASGSQQPSPTPIATGGRVDVAAPLSEEEASPIEADWPSPGHLLAEDTDPAAAARDWLSAALKNPRGPEARCITLRPSLQKVVDFVISNIDSTIQAGQNNSVLLVGGRGSGKSLCIERSVAEVCGRYNTDSTDPHVGVVRLTGSLHADERIAFREIARQLCGTFKLTFSRSASFGDNIDFLRAMLAALARAHKVAVFILDDMDAFARRPKQTLLYCLLDALQTSGVQAVVLGTTCRHDCMDLMEKRVKSRFSHRTAVLCPPARAASRLSANAAEAGPSTRAAGPAGSRPASEEGFDGAMDVLKAMLTLPEEFPDKEHASRHNAAVAAAVNAKDALSALDDYISSRPSLHDLANLASAILLETLHSRGAVVPKDAVVRACRAVAAEVDLDIQTTIAGLSVLELGVLIAAYRAASRVGGEAINFEMVDHEFRPYVTSENHVDVYTKGAACKAFERIAAQGLVAPVSGRDAARVGYGRHYTPMYVQVTIEELRKGVEAHGMVPARMKDWLAREGGPATHAVGMV